MSLLTDFALPDHEGSYLNEVHPDSEQMRGANGKARRQIRLWGRCVNDGTAFGDIWEAKVNGSTAPIIRALPATNKTIKVISDSAADAAAGAGARTIRVPYLDVAGVEHYADYTLNGVTAVVNADKRDGVVTGAPITDCWRVQPFYVLSVGTPGGSNAGNISVNDSTQTYTVGVPNTASLVYGFMAPTYNITHHGFYTVPAGYKAQIKQKLFGCIDASATVKYGKFQASITDSATGLNQTAAVAGDSSNSGGTTFPMAFETIVDEKCDIRFQGIGLAAASSEMIAIIDLIVYPKV